MTHYTHAVDLDDLTIIATDTRDGSANDLNAEGEPCADLGALRAFIRELHAQGAYDAATRDALLADAASSTLHVYDLDDLTGTAPLWYVGDETADGSVVYRVRAESPSAAASAYMDSLDVRDYVPAEHLTRGSDHTVTVTVYADDDGRVGADVWTRKMRLAMPDEYTVEAREEAREERAAWS